MADYGKELIMDLHRCNPVLFTRRYIKEYFRKVCSSIDMKRGRLCWWDDKYVPKKYKETEPHLAGTSAVQFIRTSNITIHTLDKLECIFINIFSCKDFDECDVIRFTENWFEGDVVNKQIIRRI